MSSYLFTTYILTCFMMHDFNSKMNRFLFMFIINTEMNADQ